MRRDDSGRYTLMLVRASQGPIEQLNALHRQLGEMTDRYRRDGFVPTPRTPDRFAGIESR